MSFLLLLISTLQQNWRKGQNRFCLELSGGGRGEAVGRNGPNNVCTYKNRKRWVFPLESSKGR
jgi:hypothetical protein